jgi:YHS domain-containing protein
MHEHDHAATQGLEEGRTAQHGGQTYYFCADACLKKFQAEPARYTEGGGREAEGGATAEGSRRKAEGGTTPAAAKTSMSGMAPSTTEDAGRKTEVVKDLVCGMDVDPRDPAVAARKVDYKGKAYYFCSDDCKAKFAANPDKFVK